MKNSDNPVATLSLQTFSQMNNILCDFIWQEYRYRYRLQDYIGKILVSVVTHIGRSLLKTNWQKFGSGTRTLKECSHDNCFWKIVEISAVKN